MEGARLTIFFLFSISLLSVLKANNKADTPQVFIVLVEKPEGIQLEAFYLKTLSVVLGSQEAAKKDLIYSYKNILYGFIARLTRKQAFELLAQPGVLLVTIDEKHNLPLPPTGLP